MADRRCHYTRGFLLFAFLAGALSTSVRGAIPSVEISVDWSESLAVSKTTPSLAIVFDPKMRRGSPIYKEAWDSLRGLEAQYVRFMGWHVFPRLSVAALEPPTKQGTSWDFSLIDPETVKFLEIHKDKEPIIQFSTIPKWMFKNKESIGYPKDPNEFSHSYAPYGFDAATELVDPTGRQVADYFARIFSWYTQGGFTDENGKYHRSGHRYDIPWWGILNEVQAEYQMTPQQYVVIYDAVTEEIRKINQNTKFMGPSLAPMGRLNGSRLGRRPGPEPEFIEYFLDPKNHRPGTPIDMLSYHFYATTSASQSIDSWQYSVFDQADGFLESVSFVDSIRRRLSPTTRVNLDELGILLSQDTGGPQAKIPEKYWNLYAAFYAYLYIELTKIGIDVATLSEFINAPPNQSSVGVLNWKTGKPRAPLRVLKLLIDSFSPGDTLVETRYPATPIPDVEAQAFLTRKGRKILLINKRLHPTEVRLEGAGRILGAQVVDVATGEGAPREGQVNNGRIKLDSFAVALVTVAN